VFSETSDESFSLSEKGVQKSYFMPSDAERNILNRALEKYRPNQSEPILVGGNNLLNSGGNIAASRFDP